MQPSTATLELGPDFYDPVAPAAFPEHILRFRNDHAAAEVGLDALSDAAWLDHMARFAPIDGSLPGPLALRYHGHQFRTYNPELGDGRGFTFAQLVDTRGRLMDLGTKGSGQTPWSRFGDGRLTLKGGVREVLATEMLEALGVTTSRTLSLVETGEALHRGDEPSPTRSAVMVRLSHSHVRYGTFQRLAYLDQPAAMEQLIDYVLRHFVPGEHADRHAALMHHAVAGAARLAGEWHAAGFVHGVLNTDNMNITGESFDYGPWRFLPRWDPAFTAAYFDHNGLYAFGRQAEALGWNLAALATALTRVAPVPGLQGALDRYPALFAAERTRALLWRLGVEPRDMAADAALVDALEDALAAHESPPDRLFFDWRGGALRRATGAYDRPAFAQFRAAVASHQPVQGALDHPYWSREIPETMLIAEVEALWAAIAEHDDWEPFLAKVRSVRDMGQAHVRVPVPAGARPPG